MALSGASISRRVLRLRSVTCLLLPISSLFFGLMPAQAGTFTNPLLIPTTYDPNGVAAADFNHDGNLDIVYADGANPAAIHILLGKGNGSFSHAQDIALPAGICLLNCVINVADVTGDDNLDLILSGAVFNGSTSTVTEEIATLLGNGDGTFQQPIVSILVTTFSGGPTPVDQIGIGDLNGDGAKDLVELAGGTLYVLVGNNTGEFSLAASIKTFITRGAVYLLDLNGDGHLDIVATDPLGGRFLVLLGNGDGTFQSAISYNIGPIGGLLVADLDGDGHPDVVASTYPWTTIVFLRGNANGTFAAPLTVATVPSNDAPISTGDYNSDGINDLAFLTPTGIGVLLGNGNLTYEPMVQSLAGGSNVSQVAQGDFNNDGYADIAINVEGGIALLLGNGDGTFKSAPFYDMGEQVGTVAVADFNGDHLPDIAVSLQATFPRLLLGTGNGNFQLGSDPNASYGSQSPSTDMVVGDFNGDGKNDLDMIVPTTLSPFGADFVLYGNGDGAFATPVPLPDGSTSVADVNNDGRSDIVCMCGSSIISNLGQATDSFVQVSTPLRIAVAGGTTLAIGDVNNDDKPDVVFPDGAQLEAWLGNGDGSFTYINSFGIPGQTIINRQPLRVADIDGDGKADVVTFFPGTASSLAIFYGNGDGTFQAPVPLPISHPYSEIIVADINGDNKPDLVLSDGIGIAVITNLGGRKFGSEEHFVAGQTISALSVADVNGDGYPDLIVANPAGTTVAVLLNQPNGNPPGGPQAEGVFSIVPEPAEYGQPITLKLTLSALSSSSPIPTGSVTFSADGSTVTTVSVVAGEASYGFTPSLSIGSHTLIAAYNGDGYYGPENFLVPHSVAPPVFSTQTVLVVTPASVLTSQTVRLTAAVTSTSIPAGIVTFLDGANTLGAASLNANGVATFETALLAAGTHTLTALYQGTEIYARTPQTTELFTPSTSAPVTLVVSSNATTTNLSASTTTPTAGAVVTFTATISSASGVPFGGVTFYDGNLPLGTTSLLADGKTSFSIASLGLGNHIITAAFHANGVFAEGVSPGVTIAVNAPAASSIPTFVSLSVSQGAGAGGGNSLVAHVLALDGSPAGAVMFLDGGAMLGTAEIDTGGNAKLAISAFDGALHVISASFAGTSEFAPSVSPQLTEQWPTSGPGFSVRVDNLPIMTTTGPETIRLTINSTGQFNQQIALSCDSGLPAEYSCVFSPGSITASGTSVLTLHRDPAPFQSAASLYYVMTFTIASAVLLVGFNYRRRVLLCLTLALITGCASQQPLVSGGSAMVVTIRATSDTTSGQIINSVQVPIIMAAR